MLSAMTTLLLATRNAHKVGEIGAILGDPFCLLSLQDFPGAPEVIEDANTFAGNATKKAVQLARWLATANLPISNRHFADTFVLADDSGLEVDALGGKPGVHSARFAALDTGRPGNSSDAENNAKLLRLLADVPLEKRTARFRCVLALTPVLPMQPKNASPACYADEHELGTVLCEGVCEGRIDLVPRGAGGFGYDPLFVPEGYAESFAELGEAVKNGLSHRARALTRLRTVFSRRGIICSPPGAMPTS